MISDFVLVYTRCMVVVYFVLCAFRVWFVRSL